MIRKLAESNRLLVGGSQLDEVRRHLAISQSMWHRWLAQYGGMCAVAAPSARAFRLDRSGLSEPP
jgi:hypothetical protein